MKFSKILLLIFVVVIFLAPLTAQAFDLDFDWDFDGDEQTSQNEIFNEQARQSGAENLPNALPEEVENSMIELGLSPLDPNSFQNFTFWNMMTTLFSQTMNLTSGPLSALVAVISAVVLAALCKSLTSKISNDNMSAIFTYVSALTVAAVIVYPIIELIRSATLAIQTAAGFMLVLVPILAGILLASGRVTSAAGFQTLMFGASQVVGQLAGWLIAPFISIFMALSVTSVATDGIKLEKICEIIKKCAIWVLVTAMSIFTAVMGIQTAISASGDTLGQKTARFVTGGVPIIGTNISEAWGTISASLSLLRSGVGMYGVVALLVIIVPHILALAAWKLACEFSAHAAEMFELDKISAFLRAISSGITMLIAVLVCVTLMFTVSISMITMVGRG